MNVLVLGWEYPPTVAGGLGAACFGLTTALAARGHRVYLALPDTCRPFGPDEAVEAVGSGSVERIYLPLAGALGEDAVARGGFHPYAVDSPAPLRSRRGAEAWGSAQKLYGDDLMGAVRAYTASAVSVLSGLPIDVIHAHDWMTIPAALRLRLVARHPVCLHVHSTAFDRAGANAVAGQVERGTIAGVERAGVRTADAVCAVSGYTESVLVRHYGADPAKVHVVHNALPASERLPSAAPDGDRRRRADAAGTVLFLGRLTKQKGAAFFLRAAQRVLEQRPDTRFLLAGSGEERARLIETAAELGLARRVSFLGSITDERKREAYRSADVFVLPSISEPFGLTPLEALAEGTAVILTTHAGVAEVLPSAPALEPGDAQGMAAEMVRLLDSPAARRENVERCLADASTLSWDSSASSLESVLRGAIRGSVTA